MKNLGGKVTYPRETAAATMLAHRHLPRPDADPAPPRGRAAGLRATIEGLIAQNPALVAWRAILPMAHLLGGHTQAGVAEFRALAQDEFGVGPAGHVLVHRHRAAGRDVRALRGRLVRNAPLRPVVALMHREYAEMLLARGDRERAVALLQETLEEAQSGGMSQLISRVRLRLEELRGRPARRPP